MWKVGGLRYFLRRIFFMMVLSSSNQVSPKTGRSTKWSSKRNIFTSLSYSTMKPPRYSKPSPTSTQFRSILPNYSQQQQNQSRWFSSRQGRFWMVCRSWGDRWNRVRRRWIWRRIIRTGYWRRIDNIPVRKRSIMSWKRLIGRGRRKESKGGTNAC